MRKSRLTWFIILGAILIGILWVGSWFLIDLNIKEPTDRGTFGDKFGAINSLFSGLAFLGLIITLLFQKEELELQRQELAETRKELEGQKKEFEEQNKIMRRQSFENTLFNMLSLQQEITKNLSFELDDQLKKIAEKAIDMKYNSKFSGKDVFEPIFCTALLGIRNYKYIGIKNAIKADEIDVFTTFPDVRRLDNYFRNLYRIFKLINDEKCLDDNEKYSYSTIVRSQLTEYELVMLFYNCLSKNGSEKFKPLIEKYAILNNLKTELLARPEHKELYNKSAYERKDLQAD